MTDLLKRLREDGRNGHNPLCLEAADRIEQLEREKAVVSDLWEQQKEIALDYLADCNKAADRIEAQAAEIDRLQLECQAQYDRGYYDGRQFDGAEERAKIVDWLGKTANMNPQTPEASAFVLLLCKAIKAGEWKQ